jgi:hypothetical protein
MRTTVTLDSDVENFIKEEVHRTRKSFKSVLNEALRSALCPRGTKLPELLPPRPLGLTTGMDPFGLSGIADEMEAETFLAIEGRPGKRS